MWIRRCCARVPTPPSRRCRERRLAAAWACRAWVGRAWVRCKCSLSPYTGEQMKKLNWLTIAILVAGFTAITVGCNLSKTNSTSTTTKANDNKSTNSSSSNTTVVSTPDIAGKYNVTGTNPTGGGGYKGTLEVIARGDVYQFRWSVGTQYDGVAVQNGKIVAVAYANGPDGKGCGVIDYDIQGDGGLSGK